jgi:hypothetical protein
MCQEEGTPMERWFALIAIAMALAGCASPAEQAAIDGQTCQSYGFTAGSQQLAQCRMTLDAQRQQALRNAAISFADGVQVAADNYGQAASHPAVAPAFLPACAEGYSCPNH